MSHMPQDLQISWGGLQIKAINRTVSAKKRVMKRFLPRHITEEKKV